MVPYGQIVRKEAAGAVCKQATDRTDDAGSMRSLGPRSLDVTCRACRCRTSVNVDPLSNEVTVPSLGPRMRCTKCGRLGAYVRPDWTPLRGVPGAPQP